MDGYKKEERMDLKDRGTDSEKLRSRWNCGRKQVASRQQELRSGAFSLELMLEYISPLLEMSIRGADSVGLL